jgi:DNA-binding FadR family transcriptional regulator
MYHDIINYITNSAAPVAALGSPIIAGSLARFAVNTMRTFEPANSAFTSDKPLSTHEQIARAIGMDILGGKFRPGDALPSESELLNRFRVSRTVLREVFKTLAAKGLLVSKTRVGTRVQDTSQWNLFDSDVLSWKLGLGFNAKLRDDLAEIRRALEPRAAALAAQRRTPEQLSELRKWIERMRTPNQDRRQFAEADLGLHLAVGAASGNELMRGAAAVIEAALVASFTLSSPVDEPALLAQGIANHAAIVEAIAARDGLAAAAAMLNVINMGVSRIEASEIAAAQKKGRRKK